MKGGRICGVALTRSPLDARQCWCAGLFCSVGGLKRSAQFRREFKTEQHAFTIEQFAELLLQQDLFDDGELRRRWENRIKTYRVSLKTGRQIKCQPTA